jgi:hypothetical protein
MFGNHHSHDHPISHVNRTCPMGTPTSEVDSIHSFAYIGTGHKGKYKPLMEALQRAYKRVKS